MKRKTDKSMKVKKTVKVKKINSEKKLDTKRFCPKCGTLIHARSTFCPECSTIDFDFKDIRMVLCNNCHSYNHRNKWHKFKSINAVVKKISADSIKSKIVVKNLSEQKQDELLAHKAGIKKDFSIEVHKKQEIFEIPAKLEVTLCPKCSKQGTKYFVSILQVRNASKEIIAFVRNETAKQKGKGIFINKEVPIDKYSGADIDFYLTNKNYAKVLAEKIKKNYGGIIKTNAKLFSIDWETSKNQYRLNVYIEIPKYAKDDVLKISDHLYHILSIGDKIHVVDLKNNRKTSVPYKDYYDVLKPAVFMVIKKYPEVEVLDPDTYYQARLMNAKDDVEKLEINQKVRVIIDGGEAWMI